jgi:isoquinoline 1-oxidoreductase beta subunit
MSADANHDALSRRHFLLGVGVVAAGTAAGIAWMPHILAGSAEANATFQPHAFLRIRSDGSVTVIIGKSEMGQGVYTGLPMVLAEELDVNPQHIKVEFAGVDPAFNHPFLPAQFTGGSMSTNTTYQSLREVGATARAMLLSAAAERWQVAVGTLSTDDGFVVDQNGRKLAYGALAELAATQPVPDKASVALKDPSAFRYIGKPQPRLDGRAKVTGTATFGIDVMRPQMLTAVVARPPVFGAQLKNFDATEALQVPGVYSVKTVPSGVAVLAEHTWAALQGRERLKLEWDLGPFSSTSTESLRKEWRTLLAKPGLVGDNRGDARSAWARASQKIDVEYELPYLAHACMEPLNAVAEVTDDRCELWMGTQNQSQDAQMVAAALGLPPAAVKVHTQFLGGGFGRRASGTSDFALEAAYVAQGVGRPVKVVWTREDDTRGGYYRPFSLSRVRASIGADGLPNAFHYVTVSKPVLANTTMGKFAVGANGVDPSTMEGIHDMPYAMPNLRIEIHNTTEATPILWWRAVGHSINGFVLNSAIDELAAIAGRDAYDYRRALLAERPRHLAVLDRAAQEAGWNQALPAGRYRGIALHESFGSIVAQVAEISLTDGKLRVERVVCAVDCGFAVNPDQVVAQMQSGIIYGLSAALYGEITLEGGAPVQGNFDRYPVLRQADSPAIDVFILNSGAAMGGIGEPGTPPIAAAVCNALYAANGQRIRRLPMMPTPA